MFKEFWNRIGGVARQRIGGVFGRASRDRVGATAIVAALMVTSFVGVSGLAVDVGDWFATKRAMQTAADAAAMGGALYLYQNPTASQTVTSEASIAAVNDGIPDVTGFASGSAIYPVKFTTKVTDGGLGSTQTVNVTVTKKANLFLAGVLLGSAPPISVTATGYVDNACTSSTCTNTNNNNPSTIPVVTTTTTCTGSAGGCSTPTTTVSSTTPPSGCNNGSGSCGTTASTPIQTLVNNGGVQGTGCITTAGSGTITTSGAVVTDTMACSTGVSVTPTSTSSLFCGPDGTAGATNGNESLCPGVPESLGMNPPTPSSSDVNSCQNAVSMTQGSQTLQPGIYYGGITASGTASLTLKPGVYVMYDGPFSFTSSGTLDGSSGVTIYFTGTGGSSNYGEFGYDHFTHHDCDHYYNNGNPNNTTLLDVEPSSGGKVTITAPTTGTTAGVAVSVDNGTTSAGSQGGSSTPMCNGVPMTNTVGGSGSVDISGVTYLGSHNLTVSGSGTVNANASYTMIEAGNVTVDQSSGGTLNLPAYTSSSSVPLPSGYTFNVPVVAVVQ